MSQIKIKSSIAISETGFLFMPNTGDSFSVNPIGIEIIDLLRQGKSEKEVKKAILAKFETDEATLEKDYYDFLNQLKQHNVTESDEN